MRRWCADFSFYLAEFAFCGIDVVDGAAPALGNSHQVRVYPLLFSIFPVLGALWNVFYDMLRTGSPADILDD